MRAPVLILCESGQGSLSELFQYFMLRLFFRDRRVKSESLDDIAVDLPQRLYLCVGLHALGQDGEVQLMAHLHHSPQDRNSIFCHTVVDEALIQLDAVQRILLQIGKGGEAPAEII